MSTSVSAIIVHLTPDPDAIKVEQAGRYSWLQLGPITLHTASSSPEALRAMAAALLDEAARQECAGLERAA